MVVSRRSASGDGSESERAAEAAGLLAGVPDTAVCDPDAGGGVALVGAFATGAQPVANATSAPMTSHATPGESCLPCPSRDHARPARAHHFGDAPNLPVLPATDERAVRRAHHHHTRESQRRGGHAVADDDAVVAIHGDRVAPRHVAPRVTRLAACPGVPVADVIPVERGLQRDDVRGHLEHGVVHRHGFHGREAFGDRGLEGALLPGPKAERTQLIGDGGTARSERVQERALAPYEHAAVPRVLAARHPRRRARQVGLLGELGDAIEALGDALTAFQVAEQVGSGDGMPGVTSKNRASPR